MTINVIDIRQRNALREDAGLPTLDEEFEIARRLDIDRTRAFEEKFARARPRLADVWSDKNESWLSRAARWSSARVDVRRSFDHRELNGTKDA